MPKQRLVDQMLYGLCTAQDVGLSAIARSLEEAVARIRSHGVHRDTLLSLDISDIAKPYAKKMEHLATVRDGSSDELAEGYWTCTAIGCEEGKQRIAPLYQSL